MRRKYSQSGPSVVASRQKERLGFSIFPERSVRRVFTLDSKWPKSKLCFIHSSWGIPGRLLFFLLPFFFPFLPPSFLSFFLSFHETQPKQKVVSPTSASTCCRRMAYKLARVLRRSPKKKESKWKKQIRP